MTDFRLQPKQSLAFKSTATEILFGGSAGGGKSHLMRIASIYWAMNIPNLNIYLFRRKYGDLVANHMDGGSGYYSLLKDMFESKDAKYNASDNEIVFFNGSKILLRHCQHEKDRFNYQGAEIHLLLIDEVTHFTETIYRFLRSRCRVGSLPIPEKFKGLFPRVILGANPGNIGHNWVKKAFIDPQKPFDMVQQNDDEGGMIRQYIPALLSDNKKLLESDPNYKAKLAGLGSPMQVKAMLDGNWDISEGGMFDDVYDEATHLVKPFRVPKGWRIDRSHDWGSSKPFATVWFAESNGESVAYPNGDELATLKGDLFIIAEDYGWSGKANEGLKLTKQQVALRILSIDKKMKEYHGIQVKAGPADSAIFNDKGGKNSDTSMDYKAEGVEFLNTANKSAGSRAMGWKKIRDLLVNASAEKRENAGLFIFDSCLQFKRTVPSLPRDPNNADDVDTNSEDHYGDAIRYRILQKTPEIYTTFV